MFQLVQKGRTVRGFLFSLLLAGLLLTGCDSSTGVEAGETTTFNGVVSDDAGYSKASAAVEGAAVTAATVRTDGTLLSLNGEATTDASGGFSLEVESPGAVVVLQAEKDAFRSKVLVSHEVGAQASVSAMPMTAESRAEADVYVEAKSGDQADVVTLADVALHVDSELAAEIAAGGLTTAEVALALRQGAEAEEQYARQEPTTDDEEVDESREQKRTAFLALQAQLAAAADAEARAAAVEAFADAYADVYVDAGIGAEVSAMARQTGVAAMEKVAASENISAEARLALQGQAERLAALSTAAAVEASFTSGGAAKTQLDALQQARETLVADLRAATSLAALAEARLAFKASVLDALAAELNVDATTLASAEQSIDTALAALETALILAATAEAIAAAHVTFYAQAQVSASAAFSDNSKANLGAEVLALLAL